MTVQLFALTGKAGCGKSTAASYLVERHGFTRLRFAGPLKAMLAALGLTPEEYDGALKETPCARLGGATPRWAMQSLGTEWGRDLIHPDFWAMLLQQDAQRIIAGGGRVVVDDCRFFNETEMLQRMGGKIIVIRSPTDQYLATAHVSEAHVLPFDLEIKNAKVDLGALHASLDDALAFLGTFSLQLSAQVA